MKQIRQLEDEKAVVEEGILLARKTLDWYLERLDGLREKAQSGPLQQVFQPSSSEAQQVRCTFLTAKRDFKRAEGLSRCC